MSKPPIANPTSAESVSSIICTINSSLAGAWMLDYLGEAENSKAIFDATEKVISEGNSLTYNLDGSAKASQMVDVLIEKMG